MMFVSNLCIFHLFSSMIFNHALTQELSQSAFTEPATTGEVAPQYRLSLFTFEESRPPRQAVLDRFEESNLNLTRSSISILPVTMMQLLAHLSLMLTKSTMIHEISQLNQ